VRGPRCETPARRPLAPRTSHLPFYPRGITEVPPKSEIHSASRPITPCKSRGSVFTTRSDDASYNAPRSSSSRLSAPSGSGAARSGRRSRWAPMRASAVPGCTARNCNPAPTRSQDHSAAGVAHFLRQPSLERPEIVLPPLGEDPPDGLSFPTLDLLVEVEKRTVQPGRHSSSDAGLPGSREADQDDVRRGGWRHAGDQLRLAANRPPTRAMNAS
jgi:hypothetical protein